MSVAQEDKSISRVSSKEDSDFAVTHKARSAAIKIDVKARPYAGDSNIDHYLVQYRMTAKLASWPVEEWVLA